MRWIHLLTIVLVVHRVLSQEEDETNDVSAPLPKINLDSNLRRALLKALTELENEEKERNQFSIDDESKENIVEKASAASVSIFANGESVTASPTPPSTTTSTIATPTSESYNVVFQKSQALRQQTITTIEKESDDAESILTSASSSFANQPFGKLSQTEKNEKSINQNSIFDDEKSSTKFQKFEPTALPPTVSTAENEAKVEDVQFFSAPLVAAFTVHQDELGLPNKVEAIFKPTKSPEEIRIENEQQIKLAKQREQAKLAQQHQEKLRLEEFRRQEEKLQLQQKQRALEDEIFRLNLSLKQQQEFFLRQQEELRIRNNAQSFVPISNPTFTTPSPLLNLVQQPPVRSPPAQVFKPQGVGVQQSVSFDPLIEAGKLPTNAQFLPVKGPVDFRTPFSNFNRHLAPNQVNNFNRQSPNQPNNFNQQLPNQVNNFNQQSQNNNRLFRQNNGFGNFGTNDFNRNANSFSIQPAIEQTFDNSAQNNRFFRSNSESTLPAQQFLQPPHLPQVQNNRFFRSNLESSYNVNNNGNNGFNQANSNYQLSNLLYNSGAFRGKSPEDLSLITKVLSLNHLGGRNPGISLRPELQSSFVRNF